MSKIKLIIDWTSDDFGDVHFVSGYGGEPIEKMFTGKHFLKKTGHVSVKSCLNDQSTDAHGKEINIDAASELGSPLEYSIPINLTTPILT